MSRLTECSTVPNQHFTTYHICKNLRCYWPFKIKILDRNTPFRSNFWGRWLWKIRWLRISTYFGKIEVPSRRLSIDLVLSHRKMATYILFSGFCYRVTFVTFCQILFMKGVATLSLLTFNQFQKFLHWGSDENNLSSFSENFLKLI